MLARNFKSAADLGISDVELGSLITVLGMLERDELVQGLYPMAIQARAPNEFNMAVTIENSSCGTIACLAGWAYSISGKQAFPEITKDDIGAWRNDRNLRDLFGIGKTHSELCGVTPDQAATALRSYLTTGDARWDLAVSRSPQEGAAPHE